MFYASETVLISDLTFLHFKILILSYTYIMFLRNIKFEIYIMGIFFLINH